MELHLDLIHTNQLLKTKVNRMFKMVANKYVWARCYKGNKEFPNSFNPLFWKVCQKKLDMESSRPLGNFTILH